jgi:hypothetical protein
VWGYSRLEWNKEEICTQTNLGTNNFAQEIFGLHLQGGKKG